MNTIQDPFQILTWPSDARMRTGMLRAHGPVTRLGVTRLGSIRLSLVLLLLCAVVCAQASFAFGHSHQRSSQHCCGLCHAGPLPFLQPVNSAASAPAIAMAWLCRAVDCDTPHEVRLAASSSRAPPA